MAVYSTSDRWKSFGTKGFDPGKTHKCLYVSQLKRGQKKALEKTGIKEDEQTKSDEVDPDKVKGFVRDFVKQF